jgi:ankyrin repeat protein
MQLSPQQFLDDALSERGYSTERFKAQDTGYYREPTPLQIASYDVHVLKMIVLQVHYGNGKGLHHALSCGISPDACNKYGESLVHRVCKAGNKKLLQVFLEHGASVQFANDYGRTPLHEVCSATKPCFINFEQVLRQDPHLIFLTDVLGATPLSYIRKEHYDSWIRCLDDILDVYWPIRRISMQGRQGPPPLSLKKPRSVPLPDPVNALPVQIAGWVASGKLELPIR